MFIPQQKLEFDFVRQLQTLINSKNKNYSKNLKTTRKHLLLQAMFIHDLQSSQNIDSERSYSKEKKCKILVY